VFHGDIGTTNILLSPSEAPARAILIDFEEAGTRESGESEEDWTSICEFYNDESRLGPGAVSNAYGVVPFP
jgi:hypothetical protein